MSAESERAGLIARIRKHRDEIRQLFADVAYWNTHVRTQFEEPIDPDPGGVLARIAAAYDKTLAAEARPRRIPSPASPAGLERENRDLGL
jgi:hypothetical protein